MKKILGYLANNGTVNERDAKNLTHLNVAFGQLCMDGSIDVSRLNIFEQLDKLELKLKSLRSNSLAALLSGDKSAGKAIMPSYANCEAMAA